MRKFCLAGLLWGAGCGLLGTNYTQAFGMCLCGLAYLLILARDVRL